MPVVGDGLGHAETPSRGRPWVEGAAAWQERQKLIRVNKCGSDMIVRVSQNMAHTHPCTRAQEKEGLNRSCHVVVTCDTYNMVCFR